MKNFISRNWMWAMLAFFGLLLFWPEDKKTPQQETADQEAYLRQTMVDTFHQCMREQKVEMGFDSLKKYCTWRMSRVAAIYIDKAQ